jgi:ABC-2 type transport system ATP-binding protein
MSDLPARNPASSEEPGFSAAVELDGLTFRYERRTAVDGLCLSVRASEIFGLLGPNGSGKTTTFRVLSTSLTGYSGSARIFGVEVASHAGCVRRQIGVVFQNPGLDRKLTALENLRHQGHLYGLRGPELRARIDELLDRVGCLDRKHDLIETLSSGLRRRVEVAKGLLHRPRLLLLDEPTSGLDPGARRDLWLYLAALRDRDGVTVLVTTHLLEEAERCDGLAIMHEGRRVALGTPAELKAEVGGRVLTIEGPEPDQLCHDLRTRFPLQPSVVEGKVHIAHPQAHTLISPILESLGPQIRAVRIGDPTLEDVFIHRTGHRLWDGG